MSDKEQSAEFWKKEALALVVLLRAKCSEEEWASMESRFAAECTAPAPQPCESCAGSGYFTVTYEMAADAGQPDRYGAREDCGTCGGSGFAAATPQVTPSPSVEARDWMWMRELANHWISGIQCNHAKKTDIASCACGWTDEPRMTVGTAVKSWVRHVQEIVNESLPKDFEGTSEQASPAHINRFELIDWTANGRFGCGRVTTIWEKPEEISIRYQLQDGGRTLKVFVSDSASATPQVTPTDTGNLCYCGNPMNWSASSGCYYPHVGCKRKFEGTSEQASPTPEQCPTCWSTVQGIRLEIKVHGTVRPEHWEECPNPWHSLVEPSLAEAIENNKEQ